MDYGWSIESDITVPRNHGFWWRDFSYCAEHMFSFLKVEPEIELLYVPILMHEKFRGGYPARTRRSIKRREIGVSPQLDYDAYMNGDWPTKQRIFAEGLLDGVVLFERFGASPEQLQQYRDIVEDLCVLDVQKYIKEHNLGPK